MLSMPYSKRELLEDDRIEDTGMPAGFTASFNGMLYIEESDDYVYGIYDINKDKRLAGKPELKEKFFKMLMDHSLRGRKFDVFEVGDWKTSVTVAEKRELEELRSLYASDSNSKRSGASASSAAG